MKKLIGILALSTLLSSPCQAASTSAQSYNQTLDSVIATEFPVSSYGGCHGSTSIDDKTYVQAAINAAEASTPYGTVIIDGDCRIGSTLSVTAPIKIHGLGAGFGPGAFTSNVSVLSSRSSFTSGDIISVATTFGPEIDNIQFSSESGRREGGAAIHLGNSSNFVSGSRIHDNLFLNQYDGIRESFASTTYIARNYFIAWVNAGVYTENVNVSVGETSGGYITDNQFIGDNAGAVGQVAGIYVQDGYTFITGNGFLGSQYGIYGNFSFRNAGTVHITGNSFEEDTVAGIYMKNGGSVTLAGLDISHNWFSNLSNTGSPFIGHIYIGGGSTANWVSKINISDNQTQSSITNTNACHINVQTGQNVAISDNRLDNMINVTAVMPICTGTNNAAPFVVSNNAYSGFSWGYNLGSTSVTLLDTYTKNYSVSNLPPLADGSEVYVTDGLEGSNPLSGGGSGTIARRINGVWIADGSGSGGGIALPLSVTNGGTGTSTPALVAGTNIGITGSWPAQTVGLSGTVAVAHGGTGVTTAQGNGTKVQLSSGSTTNGDCVEFDANGNTVDAGAACGTGGGGGVSPTPITNSISSDVALNSTSTYFTGPTIAQGTTGTWWVSGQATVVDSAGDAEIDCKLWDGTTVIDSGNTISNNTVNGHVIALSGYLNSPAANLRISCIDKTSTSGKIYSNKSGAGKDSTISAFRIQ